MYVSDGASNSLTVTEKVQVQQNLSQANNDFDAVATGDFNGDGNQDFVAANYGTNSVSVFFGDGNGGFPAAPTVYSVGTDPTALAVGDFGNGCLDIAVVNSGSNTVTILENTAGSFTTSQTLTVGTDPVSVAVGDFEGNGHLDLAVANKGSNTVTVFMYSGTCTFALDTALTLAGTLSVGTSPTSVAAADLNGDAMADLVVANSGDNNVGVLLSTGGGAFASMVTYAVGSTPSAVVTADFNGDGNIDIAVANEGSNTVSVLLGNGDGTFGAATAYSVGSNPVALVAGDLYGDSPVPATQLAVVNQGSDNETILANAGNGTFSMLQTDSLGEAPQSIALGDFINNGTPQEVIDGDCVFTAVKANPKPTVALMPLKDAWALSVAAVGAAKTKTILSDTSYTIDNKGAKATLDEKVFDTQKTQVDSNGGPTNSLEWYWQVSAVRLGVKDYTGPLVQVVHTTVTLNYKKGEGDPKEISNTWLIEAFQINNGLSVCADMQIVGTTYDTAMRRKLKSVVVVTTFVLGAADEFMKKAIDVSTAKPYTKVAKAEPKDGEINWTGETRTYTVTYTYDVQTITGTSGWLSLTTIPYASEAWSVLVGNEPLPTRGDAAV